MKYRHLSIPGKAQPVKVKIHRDYHKAVAELYAIPKKPRRVEKIPVPA